MVVRADVFAYSIPLRKPLRMPGGSVSVRQGFLVRLSQADGCVGWGEVAPFPGVHRESLAEAEAELREVLSRMADGRAGFVTTLPSVAFGVGWAWLTLRADGNPLRASHALAPARVRSLPLCALVSGDPGMFDAELECARIFSAVKVKVARGSCETEVAQLRTIRERLGPAVELRLDANQGWDYVQAECFFAQVAELGIAYVEEPLRNAERLGELARAHPRVPVAIDESFHATGWLPEFAAAVVLKPDRIGAPWLVADTAKRVEDAGKRAIFSSTFLSGVGTSQVLAHAGAASSAPVGADAYNWLAEDVLTQPLPLAGPEVEVEACLKAAAHPEFSKLVPVFAVGRG